MSPVTEQQTKPKRNPDPNRFVASKKVLWTDSFMNHFIKAGGVLVIVAVAGIFVFIVSQVIPLFRGAKVEEIFAAGESGETVPAASPALPEGDYVAIGCDEWLELPLAVRADGSLVFFDLAGERGIVEFPNDHLEGHQATAVAFRQDDSVLAVGTVNGAVHVLDIVYRPEFEGGKRTIREKVTTELSLSMNDGVPVKKIGIGMAESTRLVCAESGEGAGRKLGAMVFEKKRSLMGGGSWGETANADLTGFLEDGKELQSILVSNRADSIVLVFQSGEVDYLYRTGSEFELRQQFAPFADDRGNPKPIAGAGYILGEVSLSFLSEEGENTIYSLFRTEENPVRKFYPTKRLPPFPADGALIFAAGTRNKAYLLAAGNQASLRHSTTESVRWAGELPFEAYHAMIGPKYDALLFLDRDRKFHRFGLDDPHPEASGKALFGKVWYEGSPEPKFEWQSTGGSDDFEPKLSLIPLIFGTLKGTLYAMLFAVPIALFGAIYTSEFLDPKHKAFIKPTMEVMASLPSVVLGFLAALWLAPLLEDRVPSILVVVVFLPLGAFFLGWAWSKQPRTVRKYVPEGLEFLVFTPFLLLLGWLGWTLGPAVESVLFTVTDSETGQKVADFRRWWPQVTGASFEQRNSLVVGFMMGFAVIPIIFTIAEDSLSNVPGALRSGSLALGASRWQTAWRIVLPTASAGIFSALMIGLGRAVGETMIVVMATGNTPIMEWNIFSGMRTLSANIAVELPEAPHHGTLYRTLFLGAVVLFLMTFAVNTVAEILRQHLREKYKTV